MFYGCTNLKTIIVHPSTAPTITDYTFRGIAENGTLVNSTGSDYSSWLSTNTYRLGYYGWDTRIPLKADNKIFYDGTIGIDESVIYGTNGVYVRSGQEDGMKYLEYDRPITEICKFNNVSGLKKLILPSTLLYINKEFCYDVSTLTEVVFGGNEIFIGDMAFGSCENLNKYDLPLSVAYIGVCALGGTSKAVNMGAESIWFGANLQEVRGAAFSGCYNTKDVYFLGYTPPVFYTMTNYETYGSFQDMRAVFHIPAGSKTDYENAVKPYTDLGISFNFVEDIPSGEKINYGESGILTGSENNVLPPNKLRVIGWWNKTEEQITFGTYGNITNTSYSNKMVETTKGGFPFTYEVLGNGVDVSPNMSGWKNSKTYFYRLQYNPTGLSNLRFSTDPTLTFSSESVEDGVYTRTYYTTSASTATSWVSIILEGDDKFGSHLKLRVTLDRYDSSHETVQTGWS
jgi:hypothetical protein